MTATAYNRSQKCWERRPHFPYWLLLLLLSLLLFEP